jgi:hypothetical protein
MFIKAVKVKEKLSLCLISWENFTFLLQLLQTFRSTVPTSKKTPSSVLKESLGKS